MTMLAAPGTKTSLQRDDLIGLLTRHSHEGTLGHKVVSDADATELLEAFQAPDLPTLVERFLAIIAELNESVEPGIQLATKAGLNIARLPQVIDPTRSFGWRMHDATCAIKKPLDTAGDTEFLWREGISMMVTRYELERLS